MVFGVATDVQDKFALRAGIVIVFPRQDNACVGGAGTYRRGHVDNVEGLCGIADNSTFLRGGRMVVIEHLRRVNSLV